MMGYGPGAGYGYGYSHMAAGAGLLGGILMLAFWVLVIVGIVMLVKHSQGGGTSHRGHLSGTPGTPAQPLTGAAGHDEAVAIAKRRLALGEITPVEYEAIIRVLAP